MVGFDFLTLFHFFLVEELVGGGKTPRKLADIPHNQEFFGRFLLPKTFAEEFPQECEFPYVVNFQRFIQLSFIPNEFYGTVRFLPTHTSLEVFVVPSSLKFLFQATKNDFLK